MPETRHISETETLVIKDDTITHLRRSPVSGIGTRSGVPWTRWRTDQQKIFSWKRGPLDRYQIIRSHGKKIFTNITHMSYFGNTRSPLDIALSERIGVAVDNSYPDSNFTRAIQLESYPLLRENSDWRPTPGASMLLRAHDLGVGMENMFGKTRRTDAMEDAAIRAPLQRVVFVSQFRGLVNDAELIDALQSSLFAMDSGQINSATLRFLRRALKDVNYSTRKNLLMAPGRSMLAGLRDWKILVETSHDWYPNGRHDNWVSLREEISAGLRRVPYIPPANARMSRGGYVVTEGTPYPENIPVNPIRWDAVLAPANTQSPAGTYRSLLQQSGVQAQHSRGMAVDISESMIRMGVDAAEVERAVNRFSYNLTPPATGSIVREVDPFAF